MMGDIHRFPEEKPPDGSKCFVYVVPVFHPDFRHWECQLYKPSDGCYFTEDVTHWILQPDGPTQDH